MKTTEAVAPTGMYVDNERLDWLLNTVNDAVTNKKGIFVHGLHNLVPQYDLPKDIGHTSHDEPVKDPLAVARYLWLRVTCDKRSVSYRLNALTKRLWGIAEHRWIFDPKEVVEHELPDISKVIVEQLQYALLEIDSNHKKVKNMTGVIIRDNAKLLIEKYDADPRNIIHGIDTHEAWERLQEFKGWGPGLASLYLAEIMDLGIATPLNANKFMPKIDVHKPRIASNLDAIVTPPNIPYVYYNKLQKVLGRAYRDSANRTGHNMIKIDAAIWAIGSNICAQNDYHACAQFCPLAEYCTGNAREGRREALPGKPKANRSAGYLVINNADGTKVDFRKNKGQTDMFPDVHNLAREREVNLTPISVKPRRKIKDAELFVLPRAEKRKKRMIKELKNNF